MAEPQNPPVFDPVEAAKVTAGGAPAKAPAKPPPAPAQAVPPKPIAPDPAPKPKVRYLVLKSRYINVPGNAGMTMLAEGTVVSDVTHDMANLRKHGVQLQVLDD